MQRRHRGFSNSRFCGRFENGSAMGSRIRLSSPCAQYRILDRKGRCLGGRGCEWWMDSFSEAIREAHFVLGDRTLGHV